MINVATLACEKSQCYNITMSTFDQHSYSNVSHSRHNN